MLTMRSAADDVWMMYPVADDMQTTCGRDMSSANQISMIFTCADNI